MKNSAQINRSIGVIVLCVTIIITALSGIFYHQRIATDITVNDPVVERELTQAKRFIKQGDWKKAAPILERNAKGSNTQAKFEYALLFARGWGVKRDLERARNLLLQAVQRDFPARGRAAFELGRIYRKSRGEDCPRIAFEWFSKALEWNYLKAHVELGKSHARGLGIEVNIDHALNHYKLAAQYGSAAAVIPLINLIAHDRKTIAPDPGRAKLLLAEFMPMLERDANRGSATSARTLGRLYQNSHLLKSDFSKAMHWLSIASSLGDAAAMHDLALLNFSRDEKLVEAGIVLDLLKESAARGYGGAMTVLGRLHLKRQFNLKSEGAIAWFRKGIAAGHAGSMEELAKLYFTGKFIARDLKEARELAAQGALLNHRGSIALLKKIKAMRADKKAHILSPTSEKQG